MATFRRTTYPISQFIHWNEKNQLILQPKFQRRDVWEPNARSYLVDTIVRDLPMPKVYIRKVVSPKTRLSAYEVVDGQQRLRAILDFFSGSLVLRKVHNADFGDAKFNALPQPVQRAILEYEISTDVMERASDEEVWAMFERLNTYTLTLNRQERLNARWFGYFKQTAYKLAAEDRALQAWENMNVFSDRMIARMKEVEMTSDVLVATVEGIGDITGIAKAYQKYDALFRGRQKVRRIVHDELMWLSDQLAPAVRKTKFRNKAWFYSLLVATIDAKHGIPKGHGPKRLRPTDRIIERMLELNRVLSAPEPPTRFGRLKECLSRATSHVPERRVRHRWFFKMLTASDAEWKRTR